MEIKIINTNADDENYLKEIIKIYRGNKKLSKNILNDILKQGHLSILEFIDITIMLSDVPIFCQRQIMRHRHFSFAERTLRIKPKEKIKTFNHPNYFIKEQIKMGRVKYDILIDENFNSEEARCVLPLGTLTNFIMKGNLRTWVEFLQKRFCRHAQKETRDIAEEIYCQLLIDFPLVINFFNDKCYNHTKLCDKCIREI